MDNEDVGRTRHGKVSLDASVRREQVANAHWFTTSFCKSGSGGLWRRTFWHVFVVEFWPTYCSKDLEWRGKNLFWICKEIINIVKYCYFFQMTSMCDAGHKILSDIKFILWILTLDSSTLFLSSTICTWVQVYNLCTGILDMIIKIIIAKLAIAIVDIIII